MRIPSQQKSVECEVTCFSSQLQEETENRRRFPVQASLGKKQDLSKITKNRKGGRCGSSSRMPASQV
jgi:hypothetical protein